MIDMKYQFQVHVDFQAIRSSKREKSKIGQALPAEKFSGQVYRLAFRTPLKFMDSQYQNVFLAHPVLNMANWPENSFLAKNRFFIIFSSILGILQPFFRFEFKNRFDKTQIWQETWFGFFSAFVVWRIFIKVSKCQRLQHTFGQNKGICFGLLLVHFYKISESFCTFEFLITSSTKKVSRKSLSKMIWRIFSKFARLSFQHDFSRV